VDAAPDPITPFLERQGVLLLDGGLATELEARGCDLNDPLWSARALIEAPDLVRQVHFDYLEAGADCVISASYQATVDGFVRRGRGEEEAVELLLRSVRLACQARDAFASTPAGRKRLRPLVAASIGPYGASQADGSEYTGDYDLDEGGLIAFHRRRFEVLSGSGADLLACETIPSRAEARALTRLLRDTPEVRCWFSFSCRDGVHLADGTELRAVAAELSAFPQVLAVGVNCTAPRFVPSLIGEIRRVTDKRIVVYPNSGETYEAEGKVWLPSGEAIDFAQASEEWHGLGATLVGGCCRTGPRHIREIRERLVRSIRPGTG
jgi:homocysteine S-methyltransferase